MNVYAKFVLIPQQEYQRLKMTSGTKVIIDSNKPDILKRNDLAKTIKYKAPPPPRSSTPGLKKEELFGDSDDNAVDINEIQESNLPEPIKSKLIEDLEGGENFSPVSQSTPRLSFSGVLDEGATDSGRMRNKKGTIVPKSDIRKVKQYLLTKSDNKRAPPGTKAALDVLSKNPQHIQRVRNKKLRQQMNLSGQAGGGWSSLRKF